MADLGEPTYPAVLAEIISLFESLDEAEKRENLIVYADQAARHAPREDETYVLEDVRKDEECTDTVGVFLLGDNEGHLTFRISLGPQVQTLTRAMTAILCDGLNGQTSEAIAAISSDFVPRIVGGRLVRVRSQTIYYVLGRMKAAAQVLQRRTASREQR